MQKKLKKVTGYMCSVDFDHELGAAAGGNTVYPSKNDILKHCSCAKSCGVVAVEVTFKRTILKGNGSGWVNIGEWDKKGKVWLAAKKKSIKVLTTHKALLEGRVLEYQVSIERVKKEIEQATTEKNSAVKKQSKRHI